MNKSLWNIPETSKQLKVNRCTDSFGEKATYLAAMDSANTTNIMLTFGPFLFLLVLLVRVLIGETSHYQVILSMIHATDCFMWGGSHMTALWVQTQSLHCRHRK